MDVQTDAGVDAALWGLEAAFVAHPPPRSLAGCSHCQGDVWVADADPSTLALAVGKTLGAAEDFRALTPYLLWRALTDDRLDLRTVLGRIAEYWADWTDLERNAVRDLVEAVWSATLDTHPDAPGGATAVAMLDGLGALGEPPDRLLAIWEYKEIASADHHLAELVVDGHYGARIDERVLAWARAAPQRERLERARERDVGERWAGALFAACDLVG